MIKLTHISKQVQPEALKNGQKHYMKRYPRFFRVETVQYCVALYTYL
jgi:hypothetical protein